MTINVNKESTLTNVEGTRTHHSCKPVINRTTGIVYASATDAAEAFGGRVYQISACCLGKIPHYKGNKFEYVKHASENVDSLTAEIRALHAKIAAMEADAAVGRAIREEREAKQKAEENRLQAIEDLKASIAKEKERVCRREQIVERKRAEQEEAVRRLVATENKIVELNMMLMQLESEGNV